MSEEMLERLTERLSTIKLTRKARALALALLALHAQNKADEILIPKARNLSGLTLKEFESAQIQLAQLVLMWSDGVFCGLITGGTLSRLLAHEPQRIKEQQRRLEIINTYYDGLKSLKSESAKRFYNKHFKAFLKTVPPAERPIILGL